MRVTKCQKEQRHTAEQESRHAAEQRQESGKQQESGAQQSSPSEQQRAAELARSRAGLQHLIRPCPHEVMRALAHRHSCARYARLLVAHLPTLCLLSHAHTHPCRVRHEQLKQLVCTARTRVHTCKQTHTHIPAKPGMSTHTLACSSDTCTPLCSSARHSSLRDTTPSLSVSMLRKSVSRPTTCAHAHAHTHAHGLGRR